MSFPTSESTVNSVGDRDSSVDELEYEDFGWGEDEYSIYGDLEPEPEPEPAPEPSTTSYRFLSTQSFGCRICPKQFSTRFAFVLHLKKHEVKCVNCGVKFKKWKELKNHEKSCARRFNIIKIAKRKVEKKESRRPFKCQLCFRTYTKHKHLIDHLVCRCKKRYVSNSWVQKV